MGICQRIGVFMQVRNQIAVGYDKPNSAQNRKAYSSNIIAFGKEPAQVPQKEGEEKKKGFSVKKFTNVLGVALWIGAVSGYLITQVKRPKGQKIMDKLSKTEKAITGVADNLKEASKTDKKKDGLGFRLGLTFNKWSEQNKELFNNLVYGFGTVVVMPLVILFSPFGKKKSSKEDKVFTVFRQPLSFATMFTMQLTVDKLLKGFVPKFVDKNIFEDKDNIKDGKIIDYEKLKYNSKVFKEKYSEKLKDCKVDGKDIKELFKFSDFAEAEGMLRKILPSGKDFADMSPKLKKYFKVKGKEDLLATTIVILTNVFFSAPVGCTMLNVIYGKSMKKLKPEKSENKPKEQSTKGGQV